MKQNQKTRRANTLFTLAALFVVLMSNVYVGRAEEQLPLELVWEMDGIGVLFVCKPAKLVVVAKGEEFLILDLKSGAELYKDKFPKRTSVFTDYQGTKFYVYDYNTNKAKEYDMITKQLIRQIDTIYKPENISPDGVYYEWNFMNHSFIFKDINTGMVVDSFKVKNTPDQPLFERVVDNEFSYDGRYFKYGVYNKWGGSEAGVNWHIYDRQTKETVYFHYETPEEWSKYNIVFFNTQNKFVECINTQFKGDDTVYSYLRVFDLDNRKFKQEIKIGKYPISSYICVSQDDNLVSFKYYDYDANNTYFYNINENKKENFYAFTPAKYIDSTIYSLIGNGLIRTYQIVWSVGVDDEITKTEILYPNPTNTTLQINISPELFGGIWIIRDINGNIIQNGKINPLPHLTLNLIEIPIGTYFLQLTNINISKSYKLIIQR